MLVGPFYEQVYLRTLIWRDHNATMCKGRSPCTTSLLCFSFSSVSLQTSHRCTQHQLDCNVNQELMSTSEGLYETWQSPVDEKIYVTQTKTEPHSHADMEYINLPERTESLLACNGF